jgi:hypothetical protein
MPLVAQLANAGAGRRQRRREVRRGARRARAGLAIDAAVLLLACEAPLLLRGLGEVCRRALDRDPRRIVGRGVAQRLEGREAVGDVRR